MYRLSGYTLGLMFFASGLAVAQEVVTEVPTTGGEMRRVSQIMGSTVQLNNGTGYGKVEDIVLGPNHQVQYLVVNHDNQYAMLPWTAGRYNPTQRVVSYGVTPQQIQPMLFAQNAWPRMNDPAYFRHVNTVFPQAGVVIPGSNATVVPATPGAAVPAERVKVKPNGTIKVKP
jgi:sporulation protein YlmC with PRC-barrel domain